MPPHYYIGADAHGLHRGGRDHAEGEAEIGGRFSTNVISLIY